MSEEKPAEAPLPTPGSPQDHQVNAENIHPRPFSRRFVGLGLAALGIVVVLNTVGNFIGVAVANNHSNSIVKNQAAKSHQRDLERDAIEKQLATANTRIDTLVTQVHNQQTGDDHAICVLLVGFVQEARNADMPSNTAGIALLKPVLTQLKCVVPPGLLS